MEKLISSSEIHAQSAFLNKFFELLHDTDEAYCVLRNHESLPSSLGGSDLDIAVLSGRGKVVVNLATKAAEACGGFPIISYESSIHVIRFLGMNGDTPWGVALDVFEEISYKGINYLKTEKLINNAFDYQGVKVANSDDSSCLALIKELLSNGKDRKNYLAELIKIASTKPSVFDFLDPQIGDVMKDLCAENVRSKDEVFDYAVQLRKQVLQGKGFSGLMSRFKNLNNRIRRVFKPAGFTVGVLGTDGSGKTTLIDSLIPLFEEAIHNSVHYEHLRPNFMPPLSAVKSGRDTITVAVNSDPHGGKQSNFIISFIRLAYYSLDYTFGYWIKIYPKLIVRPRICIFDRYYYDFIYDPKRMKIALPKWLLKSAFLLAPKPKLTLCLVGDPELIYKRKPETNIETVSAHTKYLEGLTTKPGFIRIDTTTSYQYSIDACVKAFKGT